MNDATVLPSTDGTPVPPPSAAGTRVLWPGTLPPSAIVGNWHPIGDHSAAGVGVALENPDSGQPKIVRALAVPANYLDMTFDAAAAIPYHVWVRLRAGANSTANDSVHLQFSDSLDANRQPFARIDTTSSAEFVLQDGSSGLPPAGWGWTDNGWGALGSPIWFANTGTHTLRVQQREDGAIIDQIVISPDAYLTNAPGTTRSDTTILNQRTSTTNQNLTVVLTAPAPSGFVPRSR
jgi:hypothetical protein